MTYMTFQYEEATSFLNHPIDCLQNEVKQAHYALHEKTGPGKEMLGWLDLPHTYDRHEFQKIKTCAERIKETSDILLVIGVGGSYLGSRAAIQLLTHSFHNMLKSDERKNPKILYVGHHLSGTYIKDLFDVLMDQDISINIISKSGTTTEPAIAFRIFKKYMEERYGKEKARNRIYVTTDKTDGALKKLATEERYETFVIPDHIGGRYSVLTAVGLLPIAVSGVSIDSLLAGAQLAVDELDSFVLADNLSYQYAALRNLLYQESKWIELLVCYEPSFHYFQEWWKQLFGESEGKDGKGIFPATASFTTDLHSLGQYIQDGERHLFQTILQVEEAQKDILVENEMTDLDGLNYLAGKSLHEINKIAFKGAFSAHIDGGVPSSVLSLPVLNAFSFGYIIYFFEKACAMSGYLLGVNPFNQPGVEAYKRNMFNLLGKNINKNKNL